MEHEPGGGEHPRDVAGKKDEVPKPRRFSPVSLLPFVALAISLYSLYESGKTRAEVARMDIIKTEYALYNDMSRLQLDHPLMAHLFANTGEAYDRNVEMVTAARAPGDAQARAGRLLEERAVAHALFVAYEQTFYLWREAADGDERRLALARDNLAYFKELLCSNPRLQWYWGPDDGGKLGMAFASELQAYHQENVSKVCPAPKDSIGPFAQAKGANR